MPKTSKEFDAFAVLTEKLLKVPHAEIQKRIAGESGESLGLVLMHLIATPFVLTVGCILK